MNKINIPNKVVNIQSKVVDGNIEIAAKDSYFTQSFYFNNFYDNDIYKKFIKNIEGLIRRSVQYSNYIKFLTSDLGLTNCAILGNVSGNIVDVEFHHYPFSLYDIVNFCIIKKILKKEYFTTFDIADEVMMDHYKNIIPIVPLSKTVHDLAHNGSVFISLNQVYGDINAFIKKYSEGMNDDEIDKFNKLVEMTKENVAYSDVDILEVREN